MFWVKYVMPLIYQGTNVWHNQIIDMIFVKLGSKNFPGESKCPISHDGDPQMVC